MGEELLVLKEFKLLCKSYPFNIDYATSACPFTALFVTKDNFLTI